MLLSRPEFTARPLRPADGAAMAAVEVAVWRNAYRDILPSGFLDSLSEERKAAHWQALLASDAVMGVALASTDGRMAGFLVAGAPQDLPPGAAKDYPGEIVALNILPEWQGRGYGRRLLAHGADWLAGHGLYPPFAWIFSDHDRTRDFIENLGGRPIAGRIASIGGQRVARTAYGLRDLAKHARSGRR